MMTIDNVKVDFNRQRLVFMPDNLQDQAKF